MDRLLVAAAVAVVLCGTSHAAPANLLPNPDMEEVAGDIPLPTHWRGRLFIGKGHHRSSPEARSGKWAAEIRFDDVAKTGYYYSDLCPLPLCSTVEASAFVRVVTTAARGSKGKGAYVILFFCDSRGKGVGRVTSRYLTSSGGQWVRLAVDGTPPPGTVQTRMAVQFDGPGVALFDDAALWGRELERLDSVTLGTRSNRWTELEAGERVWLGDAIPVREPVTVAFRVDAATGFPAMVSPVLVWFAGGHQVGVVDAGAVCPIGVVGHRDIPVLPLPQADTVRPGVLCRDGKGTRTVSVKGLAVAAASRPRPAFPVANLQPQAHPRLMVAGEDLAGLRRRVRGAAADSALGRYWGIVLRHATASLGRKEIRVYSNRYSTTMPPAVPPRHKDNFPYWTGLSREIERGLECMAAAYLVTGDAKFARRAIEWAKAVAAWPSWIDPDTAKGRGSTLSTAHFCHGVATVYDFCYDQLTPGERRLLLDAMLGKGAAGVFRDATTGWAQSMAWPNGFALVMGGMGFAGSAALGDDPRAGQYVEMATRRLLDFLDTRDRTGGYVEGMTYGGYAMSHIAPFAHSLALMGDRTLGEHPYLGKTLRFAATCLAPGSGRLVNFCDSSQEGFAYWSTALLRLAEGDALGAWYLHNGGFGRSMGYWYPPYALIACPARLDVAPPDLPLSAHYGDIGWVVHRSGFGPDDFFIALRSGRHGSHCQADQNAWTLNVAGQFLGIDPGYGRSATEEHNTLLVNGESQSLCGAQVAAFAHTPDFGYSCHDASAAYAGLRRFRRHVARLRDVVVIADELVPAAATAHVESRIHHSRADDARVDVARGRVVLSRGDRRLGVVLPQAPKLDVRTGDTPRTRFAALHCDIAGHTVVAYLLVPGDDSRATLRVESAGAGAAILVERGGVTDRLVLARPRGGGSAGPVETDGKVAWCRAERGDLTHAALVAGTSLVWRGVRVIAAESVGDCGLARER